MTVLLTGASGFIGQYVLDELIDQGIDVIAISRNPMVYPSAKFRNLLFDIHHDDISKLGEVPETVIHLAWSGLPNYKEDYHLQKNLPAQIKFIDALVLKGAKNITIAGTCMEYGMQTGCLIEDQEVFPDTPYAQAKDALRKSVQGYSHGVAMKWMRLFYMYGRGQSQKSIIPQLHKAVADGDKHFDMSGGEQVRDYLPIEEMAKNVVQIALQTTVTGIINCCSGEPVKLKDFIEGYKKKNNLEIPLNLGFYPYPDYEPMEFWGDIRKLKKIKDNESK